MRRRMGRGCEPFCQFPDVSRGIICVGMIVSGHDFISDGDGASVIHTVRKVVKVEEPVHEVAANPQFMEGRKRIACTSKF